MKHLGKQAGIEVLSTSSSDFTRVIEANLREAASSNEIIKFVIIDKKILDQNAGILKSIDLIYENHRHRMGVFKPTFIMCSEGKQEKNFHRFINTGFHAFLPKPIELEAFKRTISCPD